MPWSPTPFTAGVRTWEHVQSSPASTWNVNHGLGIEPLVDVNAYDDSEVLQKAFPLAIVQVDENNTQITWSSPRKGIATFVAPPLWTIE